MARKPFVGIEFAISLGNSTKIVRVEKSKYDHFGYRPDMGGIVGCFDTFNSVVWAAPLSSVYYIKNMEEGEW